MKMKTKTQRNHRRGSASLFIALCSAGMLSSAPAPSALAQEHPIDQSRELAMKIKGHFTFVAVGDLLPEHAVTQIADPDVQATFKIIRGADAAFANMESNIADYLHYDGPIVRTTGPKEIAADVKAMGIDIVNRANNHSTEGGSEGMFETDGLLDAVGIVHAGTGRNLDEARAPRYYESSRGRVGLVGMFAVSPNGGGDEQVATNKLGVAEGSPGLDPLRLTMWQTVTQQQFDALKKIRDEIYALRANEQHPVPALPDDAPTDRLRISPLGDYFKVGAPGGLSYSMNAEDLREILRSIRNGKELSDYMIATIHTHQGTSSVSSDTFSEFPPDFLIELAHKSIDNGADVFVGHGVHLLRGIEIYKGKPIFYGLSSFVYQLNQQTVPLERYREAKADPYTTEMTDAEVLWRYWDWQGRMIRENMESVIAECQYDNGKLQQIRLYPIDLGYDAPLADKGIPRMASPAVAQRILQRLQARSQPFGTSIKIEGNIGVITLAAAGPKDK